MKDLSKEKSFIKLAVKDKKIREAHLRAIEDQESMKYNYKGVLEHTKNKWGDVDEYSIIGVTDNGDLIVRCTGSCPGR